MPQEYYSNGKLLLSGEYAVLDGAKAWAMPTKYGQHLQITQNNSGLLTWKSLDNENKKWFEVTYKKDTLTELSNTDPKISATLLKIIKEAQKLNSKFLSNAEGYDAVSKLTFPQNWGLGSSSTLINNIAQWAKVDAFQLLFNSFSGSGYDIACAKTNTPIVYQLHEGLPDVQKINTKPSFSSALYFVYLNKKRNSRDAIQAYRKRNFDAAILINKISELTLEMVSCSKLEHFEQLIVKHENLLAEALGRPTIKEELFSDYPDSIKSLGAWGGDFILVIGNKNSSAYFKEKGYSTIIPFSEMIL